MIIYLVFYLNLNFFATRVRARSENNDICLTSVDSSRCAARLANSILKIKLKSDKLVDLPNFL